VAPSVAAEQPPATRMLVYLDEAAELMPKERSIPAATALRRFLMAPDALGVAVVLVVDAIDELPDDAPDLCETWLAGKLPVLRDRREAVEALDLVDPPVDEVWLDSRLKTLGPGEFVLRSSRMRDLVEFSIATGAARQ